MNVESYCFRFDDGTVSIPRRKVKRKSSGRVHGGIGVVSLGDQPARLKEYLGPVRVGATVEVPVVLIPRPDNERYPQAIAVAVPRAEGGSMDERQIGWVRDSVLWVLHKAGVPDLALYSGWEIECTALVYFQNREPRVRLQIPSDRTELRRLVNEFRRAGHQKPELPTIYLESPFNKTVLDSISRVCPLPELGALKLVTLAADEWGLRRIAVTDSYGRKIGSWRDGYLILQDERYRAPVTQDLRSRGMTVLGTSNGAHWQLQALWRDEGLEVWARKPGVDLDIELSDFVPERTHWVVARFEESTGSLWIQDISLQHVIAAYALRVGLPVERILQSPWPWRLVELTERTLVDSGWSRSDLYGVLPTVLRALPSQIFHSSPVRETEAHASTVSAFELDYERHAYERSSLFPDSKLTGDVGACRLCCEPSAEFRASVCSEVVAYCQRCLSAAGQGVPNMSKEAAAAALGIIGQTEFAGQPLLESQLDVIHADPLAPLAPEVIDVLVLLRFALPRGQFPWTHLLVESGLIHEGMRMTRGTLVPARDGHQCFSLREKVVDDFLHQHSIPHDREPLYPQDEELNPRMRLRADWVLSDGTFVEMWGLPKDPAYAAKMNLKHDLARRGGIGVDPVRWTS